MGMRKTTKKDDSFLKYFLGWEFHIKNNRVPTKEELDKLIEEATKKAPI